MKVYITKDETVPGLPIYEVSDTPSVVADIEVEMTQELYDAIKSVQKAYWEQQDALEKLVQKPEAENE